MATTNVTGSLVLKRLKKGKVIGLYLSAKNNALQQGYDDQGKLTPDFGVAANQPVITPILTVSDGSTATITNGQWSYNDIPITFGSSSGGWTTDTSNGGKFQLNPSTWELKIVKNLAGSGNINSDTFSFTASGEAGDVSFTATASTEFVIKKLGMQTYSVGIYFKEGSKNYIEHDTDTVTLVANVMPEMKSGQVVKWFQEDGKTQIGEPGLEATVGHGDLSGEGYIYARLYENASSTKPLASGACLIRDLTDDYDVIVSLADDSPAQWDGKTPMKVKGRVVILKGGEAGTELTVDESQWVHEFRSSSENTDCGIITGKNPATVGSDQWKHVKDNEELVDFVSCTIGG